MPRSKRVDTKVIEKITIHSEETLDELGKNIIQGRVEYMFRNNYYPSNKTSMFRLFAHYIRLKHGDYYKKLGYKARIRFPYFNLTKGEAMFILEEGHPQSGF